VLAVAGEDAEPFLNRLVTNNLQAMPRGEARFAALLSPQGKLLFDFLVVRETDGFLLDCVADQAADLAKKLAMFKLRAKVAIADRSDTLGVAAIWDRVLMEAPGLAYRDPRNHGLGYRVIAPRDELTGFDDAEGEVVYEARRIALGVPKGGLDFVYGDTFVHDANMDLLHGVDFAKGCYVGQEVVSRVHHRHTARKRVARLHFYGAPPPLGASVKAGEVALGAVTSLGATEGLATLRIDRLAEAEAASMPVMAEATLVGVALPEISVVEPPTYAEDLY
jgi:folate-binding protein YgfZ